MTLLEKLEAKRREMDRRVIRTLPRGVYDFECAEMRDLLEQVQQQLKKAICSCGQH